MPTVRPPELPGSIDPRTAEYLRRLMTWAYQELERKIPKDEATRHVLLQAYDVNPGKVYEVRVTNAGALQANALPLGGGKP